MANHILLSNTNIDDIETIDAVYLFILIDTMTVEAFTYALDSNSIRTLPMTILNSNSRYFLIP